jgi:murein DD-endopeptidase MepM/ murein hydrolase activator NlpD
VLYLGGGRYGFYAHLQRGSVLVKPGDKVTAGQLMAKLGNSGNSSGPHLHFHVMNGPSVLGSEGLPYVFTTFQTAGMIDKAQFDATMDFVGDWSAGRAAPVTHTDSFPMDKQILNFA